MTTTKKIEFIDNATTKEALVYSVRYGLHFWGNIARGFNRFVHHCPWVIIATVIAGSTIWSYSEIGQARAERDSYQKVYAAQRDSIDRYQCALHLK